nr:hypothetical protein [Tanacetum cinerariifolium]
TTGRVPRIKSLAAKPPLRGSLQLDSRSEVSPTSAPINDDGPPVNGDGLRWRSAVNGGSQRWSPMADHR